MWWLLVAALSVAWSEGTSLASSLVAFSFSDYWSGFVDHWSKWIAQSNGVVVTALVIGAISILIIAQGKWKK